MPLPLLPIAMATLCGAAFLTIRRGLLPGRTDQRAEDALDDLEEGLALHRPIDRSAGDLSQTNGTARFRRRLHWGAGGVEIDGALFARLRLRRI